MNNKIIFITNSEITAGMDGPPFTIDDNPYQWSVASTLQNSMQAFSRAVLMTTGKESSVSMQLWQTGLVNVNLNGEWMHFMDPASANRMLGQVMQHASRAWDRES